ncbi:hypothetical protein BSLG_000938 [Batrachochytrium salamandrivorans]|nr:hypothetical protein BSLG_000938 [Batrachochytrium salamandrivorans]
MQYYEQLHSTTRTSRLMRKWGLVQALFLLSLIPGSAGQLPAPSDPVVAAPSNIAAPPSVASSAPIVVSSPAPPAPPAPPASSAPSATLSPAPPTAPASTDTTTNTTAPASGSGCNPYIQMCPGATCANDFQGEAQISVISPSISEYYYTGNPIVVNWTYSARTDRTQFPVKSVSIYFQQASGTGPWTLWATVPASNSSFSGIMPNPVGNSYNLRIVCDGVDPTSVTGSPASCSNPGFPRIGLSSFRVLVTDLLSVASTNPFLQTRQLVLPLKRLGQYLQV